MSELPDIVKFRAYWKARPESRDSCAHRAHAFLTALSGILNCADWRSFKAALMPLDAGTVSRVLTQNMSDSLPKHPIEKFGWYGEFQAECADGKRVATSLQCGAWALDSGGNVEVRLPEMLREDLQVNAAIVAAIVANYQPEFVTVHSRKGTRRHAAADLPFPIVDWMVYIAEAQIPPSELPMVHAVEHTGSGTLVILKKERLHLDRPEDLALVEAVEPVIRRYQKPPLPKQTHYPKQDAQH